MDIRVVSLIILCAVFISIDGHPPKCCVAVSKRIPRHVLKDMLRYEVQRSSGLCDIDAIIIYTRRIKRVCAHPRIKKHLDLLMKKERHLAMKIAAP
ncbi:C-C motif chemokine 27a [Clupea harengus]|uniref:C-C motif chemokine 27a n=1 Tax=Clupea harengus TaxID=7950 RepID=A0A6P3VF15_CLUHA|nr:C-C motif chemokine 27a [Clupea harengus]